MRVSAVVLNLVFRHPDTAVWGGFRGFTQMLAEVRKCL